VGDGLTRSIARQLDIAFFGTGGGLAPPGLFTVVNLPGDCHHHGSRFHMGEFRLGLHRAIHIGTGRFDGHCFLCLV